MNIYMNILLVLLVIALLVTEARGLILLGACDGDRKKGYKLTSLGVISTVIILTICMFVKFKIFLILNILLILIISFVVAFVLNCVMVLPLIFIVSIINI